MSHQWLLIVILGAIVLQCVLLRLRDALRWRLQRNERTEVAVVRRRASIDDCLICVIETIQDPAASGVAQGSVLPRATTVLRGLAAIKAFLDGPIEVHTVDENGVEGASVPGVVDVITVLADARATVRDAQNACDDLCRWVETECGRGSAAGTVGARLRRWPRATSPGADAADDFGMVPMTVFTRAQHDRTAA